jgi:hypothetical protein
MFSVKDWLRTVASSKPGEYTRDKMALDLRTRYMQEGLDDPGPEGADALIGEACSADFICFRKPKPACLHFVERCYPK